MLCPTPPEKLCDARGRPYFLWDNELTLAEFLILLRGSDPEQRRTWLAHLLRQAKPDDARQYVDLATISAEWETVADGVGRQREFWDWRVRRYRERGD